MLGGVDFLDSADSRVPFFFGYAPRGPRPAVLDGRAERPRQTHLIELLIECIGIPPRPGFAQSRQPVIEQIDQIGGDAS